jgi:hypothetical protein
MRVWFGPEEEARLDELIKLGKEIIAAIQQLSLGDIQISLGNIQTTLDEIKSDLDTLVTNTKPEPPVVGIEIEPGTPEPKP